MGKLIPLYIAASSRLPNELRTQIVHDVDGNLRMELELDDGVQAYIYWNPSGYEKHTLSVIKRYLKPGQTFLDLGAHVGFYSLIAAKIVGSQGRVVSVEPDPENFRQLQKNVSLNQFSNVSSINKGVSDHPGTLTLARTLQGNRASHTFAPVSDAQEYVDVEVDTIDSIVAGLRLESVDFVKVDIEGFEQRALGSSSIFDDRPIIVTEVFDQLLTRAGTSRQEYLGMLMGHGYRVEPIERDDLNFLCLPEPAND